MPRPPCTSLFPYTSLFRSELAPEAIARGAVALVVERPLDLGVPEIVVDSARAAMAPAAAAFYGDPTADRKSTRLNSSHVKISYAVFCVKKKRTLLNAGRAR